MPAGFPSAPGSPARPSARTPGFRTGPRGPGRFLPDPAPSGPLPATEPVASRSQRRASGVRVGRRLRRLDVWGRSQRGLGGLVYKIYMFFMPILFFTCISFYPVALAHFFSRQPANTMLFSILSIYFYILFIKHKRYIYFALLLFSVLFILLSKSFRNIY